jgi:hypothetical protein
MADHPFSVFTAEKDIRTRSNRIDSDVERIASGAKRPGPKAGAPKRPIPKFTPRPGNKFGVPLTGKTLSEEARRAREAARKAKLRTGQSTDQQNTKGL